MKKPLIVSIVNHKGGVGKTTVTLNLAASLDMMLNKKKKANKKILIIDNDAQANITAVLEDDYLDLEENETIARIYQGKPDFSRDIIKKCDRFNNVYYVPSIYLIEHLRDALLSKYDGMFRLRFFIEQICGDFDLILIDNRPDFSIYTKNSMVVADFVVIPTSPETLSLIGIQQIIDNIEQVKHINPGIQILGVLINMVNKIKLGHKRNRYKLYKGFGELVFNTEIHEAAAISNAIDVKKSVLEYNLTARAHKEFLDLAKESLFRLGFSDIKYNEEEALNRRMKEEIKLEKEAAKGRAK